MSAFAAVWPVLAFRDAPAAIEFLAQAFGFERTAVCARDDDPTGVEHAEMRWPPGGGVMRGTAAKDDWPSEQRAPGDDAVYVVRTDPDELFERAVGAGSIVVQAGAGSVIPTPAPQRGSRSSPDRSAPIMAPCLERLASEERWMGGCRECGAPERDGRTCREQWDELLALEFSDVRAGSVHFLTVACYQLQHPKAFPLRAEARRWLENALSEVVVQARPVSAIRDAMQRGYDGSRSVLGPPAHAAAPRHWSRTVADVGPPDAERHAGRVRSWAAAVHADLASHGTDAPDS